VSYETSDNMKAASGEREVNSSAGSLALGLGLIFGGVAVVLLAGVLVAVNGTAVMMAWFFGGAAIIAGVIQFIVGVYQCADNIDRAAKVLLDGQQISQKSDDSTAL
jgi:membrane protein DedA with SNARE-associated domain